ncbi:MAG: hypothetical protein Q9216_001660 [Gyalolechia sp. 2 TL-2023]
MAANTWESQSSRPSPNSSDPPASTGKTYDTFDYPATADNKNTLPGSKGQHTYGPPTSAGLTDALKSIKMDDFKEVHKKPCTREGFLTGIGAGFGIGGIRAILGGIWAVGAFAFGSFAMHEYCQQKRAREKAGIQRINAALDEKKIELEKKREEKRKARRMAKEEADR